MLAEAISKYAALWSRAEAEGQYGSGLFEPANKLTVRVAVGFVSNS
jgi:hypothetical protein